MTLKKFSNNSELFLSLCSEATLNFWTFQEQLLNVNLTTYDDDEMNVFIETDTVKTASLFTNNNLNICRFVMDDISEILNTKNGYFMPPENFNDLMRFASKNYSLFYGRKSILRYNVSFVGSVNFISCPISCLNDITWELK